jgi:hypothetical protein
MGFKALFTNADVAILLKKRQAVIERVILDRLSYIGEAFVNNARSKNTYIDQTGNLRSSIAYIILKDGKRIKDDYKKASKGSDGESGVNAAKAYIDELRSQFPKGYVLICVAGMEYAAAVESKGKDVLTGSSIRAKKDIEKAVSDFRRTFN